uniref:R3H-associated N-terminal domain-containing protein n=1 Tax=Kalanchoe fedtschenkoi TaxID=63787 RepID=A0A7N0ZXJ8_KALFE
MAAADVLQRERDLYASLFDLPKGEPVKSRGQLVEKKLEYLEGLNGRVSNRRARRWLNDRILVELVPRLSEEEIRGLFAPPPWGDEVPLSVFCMTGGGEWDKFRSIDMDKEASFMKAHAKTTAKVRGSKNDDKTAVLTAWHRVDCRTREALRRSFLSDFIERYETCIRTFVMESREDDHLVLHVQDPFHRLLLHGICEFYNLASATMTESKDGQLSKMTRVKKKKTTSAAIPNITLTHFLRLSKEGGW